AASHPQRETSRPLPVLRSTHEPPQPVAVLSGRPVRLEEMARPKVARKDPQMGSLRAAPSALSAPVSPDHTTLGWRGESYLRNPLRKFCRRGFGGGGDPVDPLLLGARLPRVI